MDVMQFSFNLFFALLGAFLSVVLAKILRQNGRVLAKMDEGFKKMDEGFKESLKKMDEGFRETLKEMEETRKLIARLIVEENERTRKEILEKLST